MPWLSVQGAGLPSRAPRRKRRIPRSLLSNEPIVFPLTDEEVEAQVAQEQQHDTEVLEDDKRRQSDSQAEDASTTDHVETPTPQTSNAPSDTESTSATTPSSAVAPHTAKSQQTPTQLKSRPVVPIMPAVPILPTSPAISRRPHRDSVISTTSKVSAQNDIADTDCIQSQTETSAPLVTEISPVGSEQTSKPASPPAPPKSWADLVRSKAPLPSLGQAIAPTHLPSGLATAKGETLSDVLNTMGASSTPTASKIAFLQPRGLVNNSNTCYMNSVCSTLALKTTSDADFSGSSNTHLLRSFLRLS